MVQYEAIRTLKIGELLASFGASSSWRKTILSTLCNISANNHSYFWQSCAQPFCVQPNKNLVKPCTNQGTVDAIRMLQKGNPLP